MGFFTKLIELQTQTNVRPSNLIKAVFWVRSIIDKSWKVRFDFRRFLTINRLPNYPLNIEVGPPSVDLLLVTKSEDIALLGEVIKRATINSLNPIAKIIIVLPSAEVARVVEETMNFCQDISIEVRDEEMVIPKRIREKLRVEFPELYGWVLAQFLKIWTVADSTSDGVLVLDADTLLLSQRVFLSNEGKQVLTPSNEYHRPYYDFLRNYGSYFGQLEHSFISHHMLMQPKYAREALNLWQNSMEVMTESVCENYDRTQRNPFCLCFEVYAQYMMSRHRDKVLLAKWGNLSVKRPGSEKVSIGDIANFYTDRFHSISMHSWL